MELDEMPPAGDPPEWAWWEKLLVAIIVAVGSVMFGTLCYLFFTGRIQH